jgi:hypothetical protein
MVQMTMILLDIFTLSAALQAVAAVALVILTGWTLAVLRRYAADTATIAKVSASQMENSQMPFLAVIQRTIVKPDYVFTIWSIQNQGSGPALTVRFNLRSEKGEEKTGTIGALAPAGEYELSGDMPRTIGHGTTFRIEYSSLTGLQYVTVAVLDNGEMRTQFHKPQI